MPPVTSPRDPYRDAPTGELEEPLLPRWFVLLAVATVPVAIVVLILALRAAGGDEVPVAARRPPPDGGLSHAVGEHALGPTEARPWADACPELEGVQTAGASADLEALETALRSLCETPLGQSEAAALRAFADESGVIRFAAFESTGVDSAADLEAHPPRILVNGRFSQTDPLAIAPLVVHDAVMRSGDPATAATAAAARAAEDRVCRELFDPESAPRGCRDAAELLSLPDPRSALVAAGYRPGSG